MPKHRKRIELPIVVGLPIAVSLPLAVGLSIAAALLSNGCAPQATEPQAASGVAGVEHVVVIGVDALSPDGIQNAETPHLDELLTRGAHTFRARAVMPTSSSPNWASMIMGAGPEQHGVTSNAWQPDDFETPPVAVGSGGMFPTIFGVLRQQRPESVLACFYDWDGFGRLLEQGAPDILEDGDGPVDTTNKAVAYFASNRPDLTFVHLDHVDHFGHAEGHGSDAYYEAVEEADRLIGEILTGLQEAGMLEQTVVMVSADHGGLGNGHGGNTLAEIEIPWIIAGPGIAAGRALSSPVNTYDTAVTVAYLFGVEPPEAWIGRPVLEAFR